VERSLTSVDGCVVRECGEEGFWACESALLRWSDCQVDARVPCVVLALYDVPRAWNVPCPLSAPPYLSIPWSVSRSRKFGLPSLLTAPVQATDCGDGFAREVTGGVVQQHSALGREGAS
jgi:hypothetical protein